MSRFHLHLLPLQSLFGGVHLTINSHASLRKKKKKKTNTTPKEKSYDGHFWTLTSTLSILTTTRNMSLRIFSNSITRRAVNDS